jgi:hypothetical protein
LAMRSVRPSIMALMTIRNRPSVRMVKGSDVIQALA